MADEKRYVITKEGDHTYAYVKEAQCDLLADVANLPTDWQPGSSCICLENSSVWELGQDLVWHEL